jgi:BirA family biotin operon repressor/biotin-[acetyl-CoA-carboxylase] ligase
MDDSGLPLPKGYGHTALGEIDSTNLEAHRRWMAGERGPLWLTATAQTGGRGRLGRNWVSEPGNLYATLIVTGRMSLPVAGQTSFVASLAVRDTAVALLPEGRGSSVRLKWPNDVLIDGAKVSGILVETLGQDPDGRLSLAIGCGLNLETRPEATRYPATTLREHGSMAGPARALAALADAMAHWLAVWRDGAGFADIRKAWVAAAAGLGSPMSVSTGGHEIRGRFSGLAEDGSLLLAMEGGAERRISAGEVAFAGVPEHAS